MAEEEKVYEGAVGQPIILNLGVDLATASEPKILVYRSNGAVDAWDAEVYQSTKLRYVTQTEADLPAGSLVMQGQPNLSGGPFGLSETVARKIYEKGK